MSIISRTSALGVLLASGIATKSPLGYAKTTITPTPCSRPLWGGKGSFHWALGLGERGRNRL